MKSRCRRAGPGVLGCADGGGPEFGVMPYGTECLHILRAEKGFIMIGDETDGTVIPQDLGLNWAISKKKEDYLGKRAQSAAIWLIRTAGNWWGLKRPMVAPARWRLCGGRGRERQRPAQHDRARHVDLSFANSGTGIAMGLVLNGPDRMGEVLEFPGTDGKTMHAKIVDPVFYDKEGEKQNV